MTQYHLPQIAPRVFAVGARDRNRRLFDALIPTPRGTSFNAYLVIGDDKTALIDTVGHGFEQELLAKISRLTELSSLDYLVMNHAEPDHASAIPAIMQLSRATLLATEKGAAMAAKFYGIPMEQIRIVKENDQIGLGGKTLQFIEGPWLHWPETMMTYLIPDRLLFSCDFFGAHHAGGGYADEMPELLPLAKGYFGEIMMPFRAFARKALDKLAVHDIAMIAPSHGPVYRHPQPVLDSYHRWAAGITEPKAIVAYVSMWGATENAVESMIHSLESRQIEVKPYNLAQYDLELLAEDLVDSRALVLASPTILTNLHPLVTYITEIIKLFKPPVKFGAGLNTYGWSKGGIKKITEFFENAKIETVGCVEIYGPPSDDDHRQIAELGAHLASQIENFPG